MGLRSKIRNHLLDSGVFVPATSTEVEVKELIKSLRPIDCGYPLIRLGGSRDGGYLVPDCLQDIGACFSPGTSFTADFELDLASRGIMSFMADYSVERPPVENPLFSFSKRYLGSRNDDVFMTLDSWVSNSGVPADADLILQMDIEGFEYEVLMDSSSSRLERFRVIVIEFHGMDMLLNRYGLKMFSFCLQKILNTFSVVHIHPNNCEGLVKKFDIEIPRVMEFTFLRNDFVAKRGRVHAMPHALDVHNVPFNPPIVLHPYWWSGT